MSGSKSVVETTWEIKRRDPRALRGQRMEIDGVGGFEELRVCEVASVLGVEKGVFGSDVRLGGMGVQQRRRG